MNLGYVAHIFVPEFDHLGTSCCSVDTYSFLFFLNVALQRFFSEQTILCSSRVEKNWVMRQRPLQFMMSWGLFLCSFSLNYDSFSIYFVFNLLATCQKRWMLWGATVLCCSSAKHLLEQTRVLIFSSINPIISLLMNNVSRINNVENANSRASWLFKYTITLWLHIY